MHQIQMNPIPLTSFTIDQNMQHKLSSNLAPIENMSPISAETTAVEKTPEPKSSGSINDLLFGALPKDYCSLFYFLSVIGFVLAVLVLVVGVIIGVMNGKNLTHYLAVFSGVLMYLFIYLQNRLLFGMCFK